MISIYRFQSFRLDETTLFSSSGKIFIRTFADANFKLFSDATNCTKTPEGFPWNTRAESKENQICVEAEEGYKQKRFVSFLQLTIEQDE
jgi:hypothetical protein